MAQLWLTASALIGNLVGAVGELARVDLDVELAALGLRLLECAELTAVEVVRDLREPARGELKRERPALGPGGAVNGALRGNALGEVCPRFGAGVLAAGPVVGGRSDRPACCDSSGVTIASTTT